MENKELLGPYLVCLNKILNKEQSDLEGKFAIIVFNSGEKLGKIPLYSDSLEELGKTYIQSDTAARWRRPVTLMMYKSDLVSTDKGMFSVNIKNRSEVFDFGLGLNKGLTGKPESVSGVIMKDLDYSFPPKRCPLFKYKRK
jgi:hypothetical protein